MTNRAENHESKECLSVRQMARLLRKISLKEDDILLIRKDKFSEQEILEQIKKGVERLNLKRVLAIIVDEFEDISSLNKQEMRNHGWYHISDINKLSNAIHEHVKNKQNPGEAR
jgi:bifunctional DNA-binding transcriptional regulator/antitoxin component of YhaV-PrlF toxin-antitoxin module